MEVESRSPKKALYLFGRVLRLGFSIQLLFGVLLQATSAASLEDKICCASRFNFHTTVKAFGNPFNHPDHPSDGWINHNEPVVGDVIEQRNFSFWRSIGPSGCLGHFGTRMGRTTPGLRVCTDHSHRRLQIGHHHAVQSQYGLHCSPSPGPSISPTCALLQL